MLPRRSSILNIGLAAEAVGQLSGLGSQGRVLPKLVRPGSRSNVFCQIGLCSDFEKSLIRFSFPDLSDLLACVVSDNGCFQGLDREPVAEHHLLDRRLSRSV